MSIENALALFSDRVDDYLKYRPGYPPEVIGILQKRCGLLASSVIADIGSGTGNLARLFLESGNQVLAVEPNTEMRNAGRQLLERFEKYHGIDGTAEETHLDNSSVDFITAGQAFHWFDWPCAKTEFQRILRQSGWIVLVWNDRRFVSPFEREYEQLLDDFGIDYSQVKGRGRGARHVIEQFFSGHFDTARFENRQLFDLGGLRGRLLSASYAPKPDHPNHLAMLTAVDELFRKYAKDGQVRIEYDTNMYFGQLR